jgi:hypothetical protein
MASSPGLSNGAERGEDDAWSDRESSYLSPHDDDAASSSHSLASSSPPEPMDALDGLSFGTFSPELKTRYLPRTNPVLMQDLSAEVTATCAPHYLITPLMSLTRQSRFTFPRASKSCSAGIPKRSITNPFSTSFILTKWLQLAHSTTSSSRTMRLPP